MCLVSIRHVRWINPFLLIFRVDSKVLSIKQLSKERWFEHYQICSTQLYNVQYNAVVVTDSICLSYLLFVYYFVHEYGRRIQSSTGLCVVVLWMFIAFYTVLSLLVLKGLRLPKMAFTWLILVTIRQFKFNSMFDKPAAHNVSKRKKIFFS